jgi:proline iminopeptidase
MTMFEVNGVRLHVEEIGDGPPALVLHGGLGIDQQPYRSLDPLAAHLRLIYVDHRGNGRSDRPDPTTLTMRQWADDAFALGHLLAGDEPLIVVGHSYGGFIAQELAITHPEAVRGLVLCCTTPGQLGAGEEPAAEGPPIPPEFIEMLSSMPETDEELAAGMARLTAAYLHTASPDVLGRLMADTVFSALSMRRGFEVLSTWSSVDRLHLVAAPTLIVAARHDPFTSWPQATRIASKVTDAEVVIFEESSHFPWLDEPDLFFETVIDWLRRRALIAT